VRRIAISADGNGIAIVWDLTARDPQATPRRLQGGGPTSTTVIAVDISEDRRFVVTGSWEFDFAARIWDLSVPDRRLATRTQRDGGRQSADRCGYAEAMAGSAQ
jgi:hypothetical protein